ncbi:hypothetical protein DFH09DRAFT_612879 [Mycena vulgaris]|nr:hypothetical protein DFH09DRAFT_612879 [Mycena vulgaris]
MHLPTEARTLLKPSNLKCNVHSGLITRGGACASPSELSSPYVATNTSSAMTEDSSYVVDQPMTSAYSSPTTNFPCELYLRLCKYRHWRRRPPRAYPPRPHHPLRFYRRSRTVRATSCRRRTDMNAITHIAPGSRVPISNGMRDDTAASFVQRRTTVSTRATDGSRISTPHATLRSLFPPCPRGARRAGAPLASQHARRRPHPQGSARHAMFPHPPNVRISSPPLAATPVHSTLTRTTGDDARRAAAAETIRIWESVRFRLLSLFLCCFLVFSMFLSFGGRRAYVSYPRTWTRVLGSDSYRLWGRSPQAAQLLRIAARTNPGILAQIMARRARPTDGK